MAQFSYRARRRTGELVQGVIDVPDRSAALIQIERLGLFPVNVQAAPTAGKAKTVKEPRKEVGKSVLPRGLSELLSRRRKPKLRELATFTQQLANLIQSGMPLTVALNSMTHLDTKGIPSEVSRQLRQDVMEGRSLSDAMSRQRVVFYCQSGMRSAQAARLLRRSGFGAVHNLGAMTRW